jgi:hypothetical protein
MKPRIQLGHCWYCCRCKKGVGRVAWFASNKSLALAPSSSSCLPSLSLLPSSSSFHTLTSLFHPPIQRTGGRASR